MRPPPAGEQQQDEDLSGATLGAASLVTGSQRALVIGLSTAATAVALFPILSMGILSRFILLDLGITRTQLGVAVATVSATAAVSSILIGRFVDRYGGRTSLLAVFGLSALAMLGLAVAPTYPVLVLGCLVIGLVMGSAIPATNRLVVETVPARQHGTVIGLKQSGEMLTMVASGAIMPTAALVIGWRQAIALSALVPLIALATIVAFMPAPRRRIAGARASMRKVTLPSNVLWLAGYAMTLGMAGGSVATYLPLYSQEALHLTATAGGLVVAVMGLVATVGRVVWGHLARNAIDLRSRLLAIALLAVGAALILWAAKAVDDRLVWIGAAVWGASLLSYSAVGMLAVISYSGPANIGRASGIVLAAFSIGLLTGPPAFGWSVDATGGYDLGFAMLFVELACSAAISLAWGRRPNLSRTTPPSEVPPVAA